MQERADEALGLALGLRSIGAGGAVPDPQRGAGLLKRGGVRVVEGPVGEDGLDPDPLPGEVGAGAIKEGGCTHSPLIGKDLHIGRSGYRRPPSRTGTHSRLRGVWSGVCPPSILRPPPSGMRAGFLVSGCRSSPGRSFS